jgi:hypothetical protein
MPFLINFKDELTLSVELDVTLVNNSKLRIFVILGNIVEHALGSIMVEVMLSGLLFHNTFQMQSSCLKDSGEVCMFDGVSGAGIAYPSGALEFTPGF